MKRVHLNLNGETAVLGGPGPKAQQLVDFIKSIPNGKFFDINGVAKVTKSSRNAIAQRLESITEEIDGHMLIVPSETNNTRRKIYGSRPSIASLKKELQEAGLI